MQEKEQPERHREGMGPKNEHYAQALAAERAGDYARAARFLKRGTLAKDVPSFRRLGEYYRLGWGGQPNWVKAVFCLKRAAQGGDAEAMNALGEMYERLGDTAAAVDCYYRAAHRGQSAAMAHLGDRVGGGREVHHAISCGEAPSLHWIERAREQDDRLALYLLAVYEEWQALKAPTAQQWRKDMQKAYDGYRAAAEAGSPLAMAALLWPGAYSDGCVVPLRTIPNRVLRKAGRKIYPKWGIREEARDLSRTIEKYLAASLPGLWGEETAWYALGKALWAGTTPLGQEMEKAVIFLEKAAERGSYLAMSALKDVYADEAYAGADEAKASYWLERKRRTEACVRRLTAWQERKVARALDVRSGYPYDEVVAASATAFEDEYEFSRTPRSVASRIR